MDRPYDLGDNEIHLAFEADDFDAAFARHKEMGCVCFENPKMGIYFISDPDGYWLEIVPAKKIIPLKISQTNMPKSGDVTFPVMSPLYLSKPAVIPPGTPTAITNISRLYSF